MNTFLRFLFLSGAGWLCDLATFTLLAQGAHLPPFAANVVSSYVGVTFVWFTALKTVFRRAGSPRALMLYWGYQALSILAYSQLLHAVAQLFDPMAAKIAVTPFNLLTNFLFMKFLSRSLRPH